MRYQLNVWLSKYGIQEIAKGATAEEISVHFLPSDNDMATEGWVQLGTVYVNSPPLPSREDAANLSIAALRAKLKKMRADAEQAQNALLAEISKLQALTYEEPKP